MPEQIAIIGSGAIACGLAAVATKTGDVTLLARSEQSAERARASIAKQLDRMGDEAGPGEVTVTTDAAEIAGASAFIEAVAEDAAIKGEVFQTIAAASDDDAIWATTTSSLSVGELARASGAPERFVGLHVFNPVPRMALIELAFPDEATAATRERAAALCADLGKTAVPVPDLPGFVVNRLLFPYLFSAVEFLDKTGMDAADVDEAMKLGAGHPMGPLALLDFVGLDVSAAIGEQIGSPAPARVNALIAEGALGRKSGRGFYEY